MGIAVFVWLAAAEDASSDATATEPTGTAFPNPTEAVATVTPVAPFSQADTDRIMVALNSNDSAAVAAVLVPDIREAFVAAEGDILPAGSSAALLPDRFVAIEPALGSVPLLVRGDEAANYLLIVSYVDNQWFVLSTEEVQ